MLNVPQNPIEDYQNLQTIGAKTWIPLPGDNTDLYFEELTLLGKAQLAFEASDVHEQITIQTLIGPSVHDDSYGTLHIGPSQFAQILQIGNYLPFNLHLYNGGTIVLPSAVTFQASKNVINGTLGGAVDMAVIDAEVLYGKGAASLPDVIPGRSYSKHYTLNMMGQYLAGMELNSSQLRLVALTFHLAVVS